jgi:hypothetical protein
MKRLLCLFLIISHLTLSGQGWIVDMADTNTNFFEITAKWDSIFELTTQGGPNTPDSLRAADSTSLKDFKFYGRWKEFWKTRLGKDGRFMNVYNAELDKVSGFKNTCAPSSAFKSKWVFKSFAIPSNDLDDNMMKEPGIKAFHYHQQTGTIYAGHFRVFKSTNPEITDSWKMVTNLFSDQPVQAFYVAPYDTNYMYVSYAFGREKGFFVWNGFTAEWSNRQNGLPVYDAVKLKYPVTAIATDPQKSAHVWVAFGNFPWDNVNSTERVYYSPDNGVNWTDISNGLPACPVNDLVYLENSDDVLFAATDVGVFVWNKSNNQWECFTKGMPNCIVTGLEVDYNKNTLLAITGKHGIWETHLPFSDENSSTIIPVHSGLMNGKKTDSKTMIIVK